MKQDKGASLRDRTTRASPEPASSLGHSASVPSAGDDQLVADFIAREGGEIAHDMAHHLGDEIFGLMKLHGLAQRTEAGATAMLAIAATMLLEQAIDQCSRAAEDDCRGAVVRLFLDQLTDETRAAISDAGIDLSDIPETTDFSGAVVGKYHAQAVGNADAPESPAIRNLGTQS